MRALEHFWWRIESLVREGGFALLTGEPGSGKSVTLRILAEHADGNLRVLSTVAHELLEMAARLQRSQIDQQLYFEVFAPDARPPARSADRLLAARLRDRGVPLQALQAALLPSVSLEDWSSCWPPCHLE